MAIKFRRGTATEWTAANPLLALGEPGLERDTRKLKLGDGVTLWNALGHLVPEGIDNMIAKPPAGVKLVFQFPYTNPTISRPAVPDYAIVNWVGPAGPDGSAPTNMATGDTWDMEVSSS